MADTEKKEMSFLDHLEELRRRLFRAMIPVVFFTLLVFGSAEAVGYRRILQSNATAPVPNSGSVCSVNTCDFYFQGYQNSVPIFQYAINPFSLFWLLTTDLLITVSKFGVNSHLL